LAESELSYRDVLFLADGSRSMREKLKTAGMRKIEVVKMGLKSYLLENWPISYYPHPLRVGIAFYRLLGTPGSTDIEVIVPLNPPPPTLELYRLDEFEPKGGSPLADAVRYGISVISESTRPSRRLKLISDGGNDGEKLDSVLEEVKASSLAIDTIELSNSASKELRDLATTSGGTYTRPTNLASFLEALKS
jgi:Mg-chelatase subunit ChlD